MDEKLKGFIKYCLRTKNLKYMSSFKTEFEEVKQFGIEDENFKLLIWNINNAEEFDNADAISSAVEILLDDEWDGFIHDSLNCNQLKFELSQK